MKLLVLAKTEKEIKDEGGGECSRLDGQDKTRRGHREEERGREGEAGHRGKVRGKTTEEIHYTHHPLEPQARTHSRTLLDIHINDGARAQHKQIGSTHTHTRTQEWWLGEIIWVTSGIVSKRRNVAWHGFIWIIK